jgi:hypothetical protein
MCMPSDFLSNRHNFSAAYSFPLVPLIGCYALSQNLSLSVLDVFSFSIDIYGTSKLSKWHG